MYAGAQQEGADEFMKISAWEKWILVFTAAFLLLNVGYFLGQRSSEPYRVDTQTLWTEEVGANAAEQNSTEKELVNINTADVPICSIGCTCASVLWKPNNVIPVLAFPFVHTHKYWHPKHGK